MNPSDPDAKVTKMKDGRWSSFPITDQWWLRGSKRRSLDAEPQILLLLLLVAI
jgi:hypothetical protein